MIAPKLGIKNTGETNRTYDFSERRKRKRREEKEEKKRVKTIFLKEEKRRGGRRWEVRGQGRGEEIYGK